MATFRLYKTSVTPGNDISSYVYELSPYSYRINDDFGFELPEMSFSSTVEIAAGTVLYLTEVAAESVKRISFYVKTAAYNEARMMWEYTCPHILEKLAYIKVKDIPAPSDSTWCDITPGYSLYNNQTDYVNQGQLVWARSYYQALFLMKMLIRKATGTGIAAIDSTDVDEEDSPYVGRYADGGSYYDYTFPYEELCINSGSLLRMGTADHLGVGATDFWTLEPLPNCLQLLRYLSSALRITIDIFRSDYHFELLAVSDAPAEANGLGFEEISLDRYRKYAASYGRLTGGSFDWEFGEWDGGGTYTAYTYGVDSADREVTDFKAELEDTAIATTRALSAQFAHFFRILGLSVSNYQSAGYYIINAELGETEVHQYVAALKGFWEQYAAKEKYDIPLPGLELRTPAVEIDISANRMRYERLI